MKLKILVVDAPNGGSWSLGGKSGSLTTGQEIEVDGEQLSGSFWEPASSIPDSSSKNISEA